MSKGLNTTCNDGTYPDSIGECRRMRRNCCRLCLTTVVAAHPATRPAAPTSHGSPAIINPFHTPTKNKTRTGIKKACDVFYHASYRYLATTSDYYDLRLSMKQAAEDLYGSGSTEAASISAAWDVVGVPRAPYPNPDPPTCDDTFATDPASC